MNARIRILTVVALLGALLGLGTEQAGAAGEIGLSTDGVHFAGALPGPLFAPGFVWVPGDSRTATFYVKNQATTAAVLDVTMQTGPVQTLIQTGDLTIGARVDGGAYVDATTAGDHLLVDQVPVASGTIKKIDVRVTFDPASTNQSQLRQLDLRFAVQLSQDTSVLPPTKGGGTGHGHGHTGGGGTVSGPGGLPGTGSDVTPLMLAAGAGLVALGLFLIGVARRRVRR
jgi:LPXTG-motif cell wall-anchored protein